MGTNYLVQILLPLTDNKGIPFPEDTFGEIQARLTKRFGGLTAYTRAPAKGVWAHRGQSQADDIVVIEVMTETLDQEWWGTYRAALETLLRQHAVIVRSQEIRVL